MNELTVTGQATQNQFKIENGQPWVSSLYVAEVTGNTTHIDAKNPMKRHADILRDIRVILTEAGKEFSQQHFAFTSYLDKSNRQSPMYWLSEDGSSVLLGGYSITHRITIQKKLRSLKEELKQTSQRQLPQNFKEALKSLVEQIEITEQKDLLLEEASQQLEIAAPKTDFYDKFVSSDETMSIADFCKTISCQLNKPIGRNRLFKILREFKALTAKNEATQHMVERGLMVNKITLYIDLDEIQHSEIQPRITPKGFEYILNRLISLKIIKLKQV